MDYYKYIVDVFFVKLTQLQKRADQSLLFFLAGANFLATHTKNYATMSILLIVLAFTTVLISLLSQHTVLQTP